MRSKRSVLLFLLSLFIIFLGARPLVVQAAMPAHMAIEGKNQGPIEGSCVMQGREGTIIVQGFGHSVHIPTDPQSGLPSGRRIHKPMEILKTFDKSSPRLYAALCAGEELSNVTIKFYNINTQGMEVNYFTIVLEDAHIVKMAPSFPNSLLAENESTRHMEIVSFIYKKITWTWEDGGIAHQDSWLAPVAKE